MSRKFVLQNSLTYNGTVKQRSGNQPPLNNYALIPLEGKDDTWHRFHSICREALFEQTEDEYQPEFIQSYLTRPADRTCLLLSFNDTALGTIALDDFGDGTAALRLVSIHADHRGQGHGRALGGLVEAFARGRGITMLGVNAAPNAVPYYSKLGYSEGTWSAAEDAANADDSLNQSVQMYKLL